MATKSNGNGTLKDAILSTYQDHPTLNHIQIAKLCDADPDYANRLMKEYNKTRTGQVGQDKLNELRGVASAYLTSGNNADAAAKFLGVTLKRFKMDLDHAKKLGLVFSELGCAETCVDRNRLQQQVDQMRREITNLRKLEVTSQEVRTHLFKLANADPIIPDWSIKAPSGSGVTGVPTLQLSDVHYAEVVKPEQVFNVNEYNMEIANQRIRNLAANCIDVLFNHLIAPNYPGIVICINGDMLSGDIHDELLATNEMPMMPAFVDLLGLLVWFISNMADHFQKVMVIGAAGGNHSRKTKKIPFKDKAYTNFDWLLNCLLEKWFETDDRISFNISTNMSNQFKIYDHRFRMTHGDQFRGGQGFIGPFAPITRGEIKKRSAAATYNRSYDTLIIGHFHQLMHLNRVIVNGSVVGYNEYAIGLDFPYEPPKQACWITHPKWGITYHVPVFCEKDDLSTVDSNWVSWKDDNGRPAADEKE